MNYLVSDRTLRVPILVVALGVSLLLRMQIAGDNAAQSPIAGLAFALGLLAIVAAAGWRPERPRLQPVPLGILGAAILLVFPAWLRLHAVQPPFLFPTHSFVLWATVVTAVAVTEELFLRGVLFGAIQTEWGMAAAVVVTAGLFGLLHVPLYGWGALPLDLAVGLWLSVLRAVTGGVTTPVLAHTLADLGAWWLL